MCIESRTQARELSSRSRERRAVRHIRGASRDDRTCVDVSPAAVTDVKRRAGLNRRAERW